MNGKEDNAMKKFYSILMLAAIVVVASCSKQPQPSTQMTLTATVEGAVEGTKTYLSGTSVIWAPNDAINVFAGSANEKYTLTSGSGSTDGTFQGNAVSGEITALYPYSAEATINAGVIRATLQANQNARANGFGNNTNLAVAKMESGNLVFYNVCGLIKFQIKGDNVHEVIISGNNNEDIAGTVDISWSSGVPQYTVVDGSKTISIKTYNGMVLDKGTYYAVVLPQTFTNGITITMKAHTFTTDAVVKRVFKPGDIQRTGSSALQLERAHIKPIGFVDAGLAWTYPNTITMAALRSIASKAKTDSGIYIDFSTGRTFYAIGSKDYSPYIDCCMITNGSNGITVSAISVSGNWTNKTNCDAFGTSTEDDYITNWPVKLGPRFCYIGADELTDAQYDALTTVADIKALYTAREANSVNSYYTPTINVVTNANRITTNKFIVFKTYSSTEGTGYGIIKNLAIGGAPLFIQFIYKHGLE